MDEIEQRLRDSSDSCVKFYQEWRRNEHDGDTREHLQDSIHELRKIASRLEIEMAISEREEMAQKPIPIPPHRAQRERNGNVNAGQAAVYEDDMLGNTSDQSLRGSMRPQLRRSRRRPDMPGGHGGPGGGHGGGHGGPGGPGGGEE